VSRPTPFLDFFKRGETSHDVRLLAAQGAFAPGAHEQLSLLVLLSEDADPEIRRVANDTLNRLPIPAVAAFLASSEAAASLKEFFAKRGIVPTVSASPSGIDPGQIPLLEDEDEAESDDDDDNKPVVQRLAEMSFTGRLKAALKGSREMRSILIRDTNKMIAAAVLSSPRLTDSEVEGYARMANVSDDVLRTIAANRAWTKNYGVVVALTKNPKTPLATSMTLLARLNDRDIAALSIDRNVPDALRIAARKKTVPATNN
jgi:hypothetical protein